MNGNCDFHLIKLRRISDDICLVINVIEDIDGSKLKSDLVRHLRLEKTHDLEAIRFLASVIFPDCSLLTS